MKTLRSHRLSLRSEDAGPRELEFNSGCGLGRCVRKDGASGFRLRSAPDLTDQTIKQAGLFDWFDQHGLDPLFAPIRRNRRRDPTR